MATVKKTTTKAEPAKKAAPTKKAEPVKKLLLLKKQNLLKQKYLLQKNQKERELKDIIFLKIQRIKNGDFSLQEVTKLSKNLIHNFKHTVMLKI